MSAQRRRALLFVVPGGALGVLVVAALVRMPAFGHPLPAYARYLAGTVQHQRHVTNLVTSIVFDQRGFDTLGEESILFAAVMGTALLLRASRGVQEQLPLDPAPTEAVRGYGSAMVPVLTLLGLWTIAYGTVTPGGGFQGGVVAAAAALFVWVADSYRSFRAVTPRLLLHLCEGTALTAFAGVGLVALAQGSPYLTNRLPLGTAGQLTSGGSIGVLNALTGLEVAAAVVLLFHEFLQEHLQTLPGTREDR